MASSKRTTTNDTVVTFQSAHTANSPVGSTFRINTLFHLGQRERDREREREREREKKKKTKSRKTNEVSDTTKKKTKEKQHL